MLIHLLSFGHVDTGRGGHNQGGAERVVTTQSVWYRGGPGGCSPGGPSGFEAGRWVLPKRSALNDSSVTCPEALSDGHAKERVLCYLSVSNTINIITYTDV